MQNTHIHQFIALEGISGSGKTELSKLLAQQIFAQYYTTPPETFRLSRREVDEKACLESRFLFYLASVVYASHEIDKILKTQSVVCDKYIWSTICYHTTLGLNVKIPQWITYRQPDHTFLIVCDNDVRLKRLRLRCGPVMDKEKYEMRQKMEQQCLIEHRTHLLTEVNNTIDGPQNAVDQILAIIKNNY